ncbi:MAG: DNA replication/repair protein RecF [Gammaproteobacteria bacterium]|nr:MAG: DNA replication/repair protein RecF [Gammaproteobacteria bacterium]
MPLINLDVFNIRVIEKASIQPCPGLNVISGDNAAGKTSLLEAIHILGTGRSFRTKKLDNLITQEQEFSLLRGHYLSGKGRDFDVGIERKKRTTTVHINGESVINAANLARIAPLRVVEPNSHQEFKSNIKKRRAALDWGLFHVEPSYHQTWLNYSHLLKQRNAALRSGATFIRTFPSWNRQLSEYAEILKVQREDYFSVWESYFRKQNNLLLKNLPVVSLKLKNGWDTERNLTECLKLDYERDKSQGYTHSGPHRADILVSVKGKPAAEVASHGQYKLIIMALLLSQLSLLSDREETSPILLLDDSGAELDHEHLDMLMGELSTLPLQVFFTTTNKAGFEKFAENQSTFHVEHGQIQQIF